MKGRSHRLQSSDPHEDWIDGSWTVDCVCGVNFDDGEEMVNCDECGVWVHTRCSRYVKGDESFACDKCKSKNNRNDSEETEVAQLLVELPTKTVRMESSYAANLPARRPFRLWADVPMEERVHVQGVPGGDPALFGGLSSVFTPELWKCTGYVPKKFNFQYREFPCWDENEKGEDENEKTVNNGAGVLFSLSKESVLATPVTALVGLRGGDDGGAYDPKVGLKDAKKWEGDDVDVRSSPNGVKKDRALFNPVTVHSNKGKKEELGTSKDRSSKKKARAVEKEADEKKRGAHTSKAVFRPTSDAKQFYEDGDPKSYKNDIQSIKNKNSEDSVLREPISDSNLSVNNGCKRTNNNSVAIERSTEASLSDGSGRNPSIEAGTKDEKADHQVSAGFKSSSKADNASLFEKKDAESNPVKEEEDSMVANKLDGSMEGSARSAAIPAKPPIDDIASTEPVLKGKQILEDFNGDMSRSSLQPDVEVKMEMDNNSRGVSSFQSSPPVDAKDPGIAFDHMSETFKFNDVAASSLQFTDHKVQGVDRTSEAISDCHTDKADELSIKYCQLKQELEGSEGSLAVQKGSSESKHGSGLLEEPSKSNEAVLNTVAPSSQRKMVVCVGKSFSTSSTTVKSSGIDNFKPADPQNSNPSSKQRLMCDSNASSKKDCASSDVVRDEDRHDVSRKTVKEHPKSSVPTKVSHRSRISHTSISKRIVSDSKDSVPSSSSKASSSQNAAVTSGSCEALQSQCGASEVQKTSSSSFPQKGEKPNQPNFQSSSKNPIQSMHPPGPANSSATLSDEELALLLHQELNSSPRVPRVPRVRHPGSLPQLASPTATSMLIKRTSTSGGKDHGLVSRRKNKDASKGGFRFSRELDDEAQKTNKVPSSPDQRKQDTGHTTDASTKREDHEFSVKKNMPPSSTTTTNSGPSSSNEANDHNFSSMRNSPRNMSDDDMGTVRGPVHRTLPGLINEIMSEGRRMSYEELCNSVLPHWPNLRKHNGARYAYSSHSQAVLDCLRNRHEWAQLVDRGPKTNSSRKRRKLDAEESEDNEYGKGQITKEAEVQSLEAQKEDVPKGKRKARKRRRLALQGRGIKDIRKRRKAEFTDDDIGPFSDSSEDSMFSEDEIQGGGACPVGSEASTSSDEMGTL